MAVGSELTFLGSRYPLNVAGGLQPPNGDKLTLRYPVCQHIFTRNFVLP